MRPDVLANPSSERTGPGTLGVTAHAAHVER
jgi:hypothetical protein